MLRILAHTLLSLITLHIQKKDKAVEKKRRLKREQAKAADGYLPKWRSNHLPRRRRERGGKAIVLTLMLLQCSAATQQQTAVLQQVLLSAQSGHNFLFFQLIVLIFKLLSLRTS